MKRLVLSACLLGALAAVWLALPVRWEVEGVSMAPGFMPGDMVGSGAFPVRDRWRKVRRHECWTFLAPGGEMILKRVVGLPGEDVEIVDGDLNVDGATIAKPPAVLAEVALPVAATPLVKTPQRVSIEFSEQVLDDVPFAPEERRRLQPVRDLGIVAVCCVKASEPAAPPPAVEVDVGGRSARVVFHAVGRHAVVAGRLDEAFVAAGWRLPERIVRLWSCLPAGSPEDWTVRSPWAGGDPVLRLEVRVAPSDPSSAQVVLEDVVVWRDVHHLPPASGTTRWRVGTNAYFLLGDFPAGSHDSRLMGPIDALHLRNRVVQHPDR